MTARYVQQTYKQVRSVSRCLLERFVLRALWNVTRLLSASRRTIQSPPDVGCSRRMITEAVRGCLSAAPSRSEQQSEDREAGNKERDRADQFVLSVENESAGPLHPPQNQLGQSVYMRDLRLVA